MLQRLTKADFNFCSPLAMLISCSPRGKGLRLSDFDVEAASTEGDNGGREGGGREGGGNEGEGGIGINSNGWSAYGTRRVIGGL